MVKLIKNNDSGLPLPQTKALNPIKQAILNNKEFLRISAKASKQCVK